MTVRLRWAAYNGRMNIDAILTDETAAFIREHRAEDVRDLALHAKRTPGLDLPFALDQIAGWQTARAKLPEWAAHEGIVYPPHLSMEQCSSEATARHKAALAASLIAGNMADGDTDGDGGAGTAAGTSTSLVDLTGGFGVDFSYMAPAFDHATYVERQPGLCDVARHNLRELGLDGRAGVVNADAEEYLARMEPVSLIFLDPARRDAHGARTYAVSDCTPDALALRDTLLAKAPHVMVKLSPMLDWHKTVADFNRTDDGMDSADSVGCVSQVHIASAGGECKELLVVLSRGHRGPATVHCANDGADFAFRADEPPAAQAQPPCAMADLTAMLDAGPAWLAEPNASVMKAGRFDLVAARFAMRPLGRDSHLFVASARPVAFPGRVFALDMVTGMGKRDLRRMIGDLTHANITTRNFPMGATQLRKKLGLKDGGDVTLFATTTADGARVLLRAHRA